MTNDYTCSVLRERIAVCFDYALSFLNIPEKTFADAFCKSGYTAEVERGSAKYLFGMSGSDLCELILEDSGIPFTPAPYFLYDKSEYYWAGDYVAYYQFAKDCSFKHIFSFLPIERLLGMYAVYHETDVTYFADELDRLCKARPSNLSSIRKERGLSQSDLSLVSGVPLRTIQAYEQKSKDINRAETCTVLSLCMGLCCDVTDIMEL